jgi:hypothetical protein
VPVDLRVTGADQLAVLGRRLQAAGAKDLRVDLAKSIHRIVRDASVRVAIAASARATLPSSGGLAEYVAATKVVTTIRTGGRNVGITIVGSRRKRGKQANLSAINAGRVMHPVYGRAPMVPQSVTPGFFDKPLEGDVSDDMRRAIVSAIDDVARRIT